MEFIQYSPVIAQHIQVLTKASRASAEAEGLLWKARKAFEEAVTSHLRAQGLTEGRQVWQVQRDGKTVKRKVTDLQVSYGMVGNELNWEIVVHMDDPESEFGALATLPNVHLRAGTYQFVPRKVD